jgi:hypothetical protein
MNKVTLNRADIAELNKVLAENPEIDSFDLITHNESGIGYCVDIEYPTFINNRVATVRLAVVGVESW